MKEIRKTDSYKKWIKNLQDSRAKSHIYARIDRLAIGNPGDWKSVGEGVIEMRIDYGPGYRVYYKDTGQEIIILLCGGDKSTQQEDIAKAKELVKEESEDENN
ncbi:addiction module antitoxin RelB [Spirochaetia bacterium]|nr:addiction module antitoxin RelB [Spirochaetia bacterium]